MAFAVQNVSAETIDRWAPPRDEPAFRGHAAEHATRDPADEVRHRRLFFDAAGREIGEAGVDCGHRAASRPDLVAGGGLVVVAWDAASGRVLVRFWVPPGADGRPSVTEAEARRQVAAAVVPTSSASIESLRFSWCR